MNQAATRLRAGSTNGSTATKPAEAFKPSPAYRSRRSADSRISNYPPSHRVMRIFFKLTIRPIGQTGVDKGVIIAYSEGLSAVVEMPYSPQEVHLGTTNRSIAVQQKEISI